MAQIYESRRAGVKLSLKSVPYEIVSAEPLTKAIIA